MTARYRLIEQTSFHLTMIDNKKVSKSPTESYTDFDSLEELEEYLIDCEIVDSISRDQLQMLEDTAAKTKVHIARVSSMFLERDFYLIKRSNDQFNKNRTYLVTTILFDKKMIHLTGQTFEKVASVTNKRFTDIEELLQCFNKKVARKLRKDLEMYDARYMTESQLVTEDHFGATYHSQVYLQLIEE